MKDSEKRIRNRMTLKIFVAAIIIKGMALIIWKDDPEFFMPKLTYSYDNMQRHYMKPIENILINCLEKDDLDAVVCIEIILSCNNDDGRSAFFLPDVIFFTI